MLYHLKTIMNSDGNALELELMKMLELSSLHVNIVKIPTVHAFTQKLKINMTKTL